MDLESSGLMRIFVLMFFFRKSRFTKKFLCGLVYLCDHEGANARAGKKQEVTERDPEQREEHEEVSEDPADRLAKLSRLCAGVYFTLFKDLLA